MGSRLFFTLFVLCSLFTSYGQEDIACSPDTMILDSTGAIFPQPFLPGDTTGTTGITKVACINEPFEFVFTVFIPQSASLGGLTLLLNGARCDTVGAIDSLPKGIDYDCNPSDCNYTALVPSCLVLKGIPSPENDTGLYNVTLNFELLTQIGGIGVTFPGDQFPGNYFLRLLPEGSPECGEPLSTKSPSKSNLYLYNAPNPFSGSTTLYMHIDEPETMQLLVTDMMGKVLVERNVRVKTGINQLPLQGLDFPSGIYVCTLSNLKKRMTTKLVVRQ